MNKKLGVIDGGLDGKKPDVVHLKVVTLGGTFAGACDLDTRERAFEAMKEQGYLDLVDINGMMFRVFERHTILIVHVETKSRIVAAKPGILIPGAANAH
jgi:hypothetical protein